jgi:hypothetical protein
MALNNHRTGISVKAYRGRTEPEKKKQKKKNKKKKRKKKKGQ